jgi:hypothetical protein
MAKCHRCATENSLDAAFCNRCGLQFTAQVRQKTTFGTFLGWAIIIGTATLFCMGMIAVFIIPKPTSQQLPTAQTVASTPYPTTNAERLATAKTLLTQERVSVGERDEAVRFLKAIPKDAKEYKEAQVLLKPELIREEIEKEQTRKNAIATRRNMADKLETSMLDAGYDFYITVEGKEAEIMRIKYVLTSRPMVHKITKETEILTNLRNAGFKTVIFTDGYDESYSMDL